MSAVGSRVKLERRELDFVDDSVANFLDGRSDDGRGVFGMAEFQVHAAADVLKFQHRPSPGRAGDRNLHGLRTELRVTGDESFAATQEDCRVPVVQGANFENGGRWKIVEKNAPLNFRLDDAAVHFVGQVGVRVKHTDDRE